MTWNAASKRIRGSEQATQGGSVERSVASGAMQQHYSGRGGSHGGGGGGGHQQQQQQQQQGGGGQQRRFNSRPWVQGFGGSASADLPDDRKPKPRNPIHRRTIDYGPVVMRHLDARAAWLRSPTDRLLLEPDPNFVVNMQLPGAATLAETLPSRLVCSPTNKERYPINAVSWTPEGRRLLTGATSGEITLWNGLTFNFETMMQAHDRAIRCMEWSSNGTWLISGDDAGVIKYWQSSLTNVKAIQGHSEPIRGMDFSPTNSKFVTCADDSTLKVFSFADALEERVLKGHGWDVKCVSWHPSKALIASGSKDNVAKLWCPSTGECLCTLHGHKNTVLAVEWHKDGNLLATACRDQIVRLYDVRNLKNPISFKGHKKEVQTLKWHPTDSSLLVSGGGDGSLLFWSAFDNSGPIASIEGAHELAVFSIAWHPLGHIMVTGGNDRITRFWCRSRPGDVVDQVITDPYAVEGGEYTPIVQQSTKSYYNAFADFAGPIPGISKLMNVN